MLRTSAVPTVANKTGDFNNDEFVSQLREVTPPGGVTIANTITRILTRAANAVKVFFYGVNEESKILATSDAADGNDVFAASENGKTVVLRPVPGQSGRSLAFEVESSDAGFDEDFLESIEALVSPARPKFTVGSLTQQIAAAYPLEIENVPLLIEVNQHTGKVRIRTVSDTSEFDNLPATCAADAHGIVVELPVEEITDAPVNNTALKFEGGAV